MCECTLQAKSCLKVAWFAVKIGVLFMFLLLLLLILFPLDLNLHNTICCRDFIYTLHVVYHKVGIKEQTNEHLMARKASNRIGFKLSSACHYRVYIAT